MHKPTALIVIDYTNDFVDTKGALTCGEAGKSIDEAILALCQNQLEEKGYIFFLNDIHFKDNQFHPEAKLFPPHNLEGSWGREIYGKTGRFYVENKNNRNVILMDKTRYSAFAGTNLHILLTERGIDSVVLCGVCTDICVLHSAVDAYNLGLGITVHGSCVASFNQIGHSWALEHFKSALNAAVI